MTRTDFTSERPAGRASTAKRLKVVHVINSLGIGGAELCLYRLMTHSDPELFEMQVISLLPERGLSCELREAGFTVHCLNMGKSIWDCQAWWRLVRILRTEKPDLIQTWLQQSDLLGGLAARVAGVGPVLWNIRHSTLDPSLAKVGTRLFSRACALLSPWIPLRIVCCSEASREEQVKLGYRAGKMVVIPNGVDMTRFKLNREAGNRLRSHLGIPSDAIVFGAAGRYHPAKDHASLIRAAGAIAEGCEQSHFIFIGHAVSMENPALRGLVQGTGFGHRFHLLGQRQDVPECMAAMDVFISSSCFSEGFPNVVSEAMACGVSCIVTDVGDSARIVGDTGTVTPPRRPDAITAAGLQLARLGRSEIRNHGIRAHNRIKEKFSLSTMVDRYEHLYTELDETPKAFGLDRDEPAGCTDINHRGAVR